MKNWTNKEVKELLDSLLSKNPEDIRIMSSGIMSIITSEYYNQFKRDHGLIEDELKVGEWYKGIYKLGNRPFLFNYVEMDSEGNYEGYGFCEGWSGWACWNPDDWTKATHQEVKDALVKHWEKDNEAFDDYAWHTDGDYKGKLYGWKKLESAIELFDNGVWKDIEPTKEQKIEILWKERNK